METVAWLSGLPKKFAVIAKKCKHIVMQDSFVTVRNQNRYTVRNSFFSASRRGIPSNRPLELRPWTHWSDCVDSLDFSALT